MKPPHIQRAQRPIIEQLRHVVEGPGDWSASGSSQARLIIHQLGLPMKNTTVKDVDQILAGMGVTDVTKLRPMERNKIIKRLHKKYNEMMRQADGLKDTLYGKYDELIDPIAKATQRRREGEQYSPEMEEDIRLIAAALGRPLVLERPQGTSMHHMIDFLDTTPGRDAPMLTFLKNKFQSFVVEHDWAKAFEGVKDFDGGEVLLPFDFTCFEFRLNGLRILLTLGYGEAGDIKGMIMTGINKRWYVSSDKFSFDYVGADDVHTKVVRFLAAQVRAVCIMLDAKVAVGTKKSLGGEGLNRKRRAEGLSELRDYHVVSLSKRTSYGSHVTGEGAKKRCHWRRGHWRHFTTPGGSVQYTSNDGVLVSKSWVNWMLVGDIELGFVEKHYKL